MREPTISRRSIRLLGGGGFEGSLREVRDLEKALGIDDLATLTPR